jgi:hypothetical protein
MFTHNSFIYAIKLYNASLCGSVYVFLSFNSYNYPPHAHSSLNQFAELGEVCDFDLSK